MLRALRRALAISFACCAALPSPARAAPAVTKLSDAKGGWGSVPLSIAAAPDRFAVVWTEEGQVVKAAIVDAAGAVVRPGVAIAKVEDPARFAGVFVRWAKDRWRVGMCADDMETGAFYWGELAPDGTYTAGGHWTDKDMFGSLACYRAALDPSGHEMWVTAEWVPMGETDGATWLAVEALGAAPRRVHEGHFYVASPRATFLTDGKGSAVLDAKGKRKPFKHAKGAVVRDVLPTAGGGFALVLDTWDKKAKRTLRWLQEVDDAFVAIGKPVAVEVPLLPKAGYTFDPAYALSAAGALAVSGCTAEGPAVWFRGDPATGIVRLGRAACERSPVLSFGPSGALAAAWWSSDAGGGLSVAVFGGAPAPTAAPASAPAPAPVATPTPASAPAPFGPVVVLSGSDPHAGLPALSEDGTEIALPDFWEDPAMGYMNNVRVGKVGKVIGAETFEIGFASDDPEMLAEPLAKINARLAAGRFRSVPLVHVAVGGAAVALGDGLSVSLSKVKKKLSLKVTSGGKDAGAGVLGGDAEVKGVALVRGGGATYVYVYSWTFKKGVNAPDWLVVNVTP